MKPSERTIHLCLAATLVFHTSVVAPASAGDTTKSTKSASSKPSANAQTEMKAYKLCVEASRFKASGDYEKAKEIYQSAVALDPTSYSPTIHLGIAQCLKAQNLNAQALIEGKLALQFDPNYEDAIYLVGQIYKNLDQNEECLKYLKQYVAITKDAAMKKATQDYINKTSVYTNMVAANKSIADGKHSEALRLLKLAAAYDPSPHSGQIHAIMSYLYQKLGEPEKAIDEGKKALEINSSDKRTIYNIAVAYQDLAKFDESLKWFKRYEKEETDPAALAGVKDVMAVLEIDRKQLNQDANRKPDYLDEMRDGKTNPKWPTSSLPIRVYIAPGKGVLGFQPKFKSYITHALDTWCVSSGKKLNYKLVKDRSQADLTVDWTTDKIDHNDGKPGLAAGVTHLECDGETIKKAAVEILTVDTFARTSPVPKEVCAFVCLHEIGHALGISHSTFIYDVMYFRSSSKQKGNPTSRDNATIARLYSGYRPLDFHAQSEDTGPISFLPPPMFIPPKLKVPPPIAKLLYVPPPLVSERKLEPPLYTPPPLAPQSDLRKSEETGKSPSPSISPKPLLFVPPPLERKKSEKAPTPAKKSPPQPNLYVPPPLR